MAPGKKNQTCLKPERWWVTLTSWLGRVDDLFRPSPKWLSDAPGKVPHMIFWAPLGSRPGLEFCLTTNRNEKTSFNVNAQYQLQLKGHPTIQISLGDIKWLESIRCILSHQWTLPSSPHHHHHQSNQCGCPDGQQVIVNVQHAEHKFLWPGRSLVFRPRLESDWKFFMMRSLRLCSISPCSTEMVRSLDVQSATPPSFSSWQ